jgi:hypothetical protein
MSSKEKVVPITRGERRPNQECLALIVGPTRLDFGFEPAQPVRRRPATVVQLVNNRGRIAGVTEPAACNRMSSNPEESSR